MIARWSCFAVLVSSLAACGGGSGDHPPSQDYAGKCETPRTGIDPITSKGYPDTPGSLDDERTWVRSWIDEYYLWYREVPDVDPSSYPTAVDYFDVLKTPATTSTGHPKDKFHFIYPTDVWENLSQSGVEAGYGVTWAVIAPSPPRRVVVAYTEPSSGPGGPPPVARGAEVLMVDGVDVVNGDDYMALNAGLFPNAAGESHTFVVQDVGATTTRTVTMMSADVTGQPVQDVTTVANGAVGYMLFNDHIATAEGELVTAIGQLQAAGVTDLVLDMRYNGGGYLAIASELGYMIAGPSTTGKTFELETFNDKYPTTDPISGQPLTPTPFYDTTNFAPTSAPLPHLDLARVFVLTGPGTCSASEAVMNGLEGAGVQVIQIGSATCGKPYGFYPQDNCGTTYFSIQFKGVNNQGFGDYTDGFSTDGSTSAHLDGCAVPDDFTHALGDPAEGRLAAALAYRDSGTCPAAAAAAFASNPREAPLSAVDGRVIRPPWRENRIFR